MSTRARAFVVFVFAWSVLSIGAQGADGNNWNVTTVGDELRIGFGSGTAVPQYAALHLDSSYFRMTPTTSSGWGSSVLLMPPLRTDHRYVQGARVACDWAVRDADLVLTVTGSVSTLSVTTVVRLHPPHDGFFVADVSSSAEGSVLLDVTPGETFKPVMFSSMHESSTAWDASTAYIDHDEHGLPPSGWIVAPPVVASRLGLRGGNSDWKTGAPTIEANLLSPSSLAVTGWVTSSQNPNDDNVALWANSDTALASWSYQLVAKTEAQTAFTPPAFRVSPASRSVPSGQEVSFHASALGTPAPTLLWQLSRDRGESWSPLANDFVDSGVTSETLRVASASLTLDDTRYRCVATNSFGTTPSSPALLSVTTGTGRLVNLSVRARCGDGDQVTIGGVVIVGDTPKRVLVRAIGPTLTNYGIAPGDVLSDPTIEVDHAGGVVADNDNWTENANRNEILAVSETLGASPLASGDEKSSVLLLTLNPGIYTVVVRGNSSASGIVLLEFYDADPADRRSRFTNLSARAHCRVGDNIAIGGFVVGGPSAQHVLLRAVGTTLASYGIAVSALLSDPMLEVHRGSSILASNDDGADDIDAAALRETGARLGAAPLAASDRRSSGLLLTLPAGPWTYHASGKDGTSGIVLVEIYDAE